MRTGSSARRGVAGSPAAPGSLFLAPRPVRRTAVGGIPTAIYSDFKYSASSVFSDSVSLSLKNWS
jgi:hypothetical protein